MWMQAEAFYQQIATIAAQPPSERQQGLTVLHHNVLARYLDTVESISERGACRVSSDGRTIAQIIGHIAEWERWTILAAGEMIAGVRWPQIMRLCGYVEPDGTARDFGSVDAFNAYQAERQSGWPWKRIRNLAIRTASTLHTIFVQPAMLSPEWLQQTGLYHWRLPHELTLTIPAGWYLWMVSLEHEAIEHAADLELGRHS